jgi:hypothetical protein
MTPRSAQTVVPNTAHKTVRRGVCGDYCVTYNPGPGIKGDILERVRDNALVSVIKPTCWIEQVRIGAPQVRVTLHEHRAVDHRRMRSGHVQRRLGGARWKNDRVGGRPLVERNWGK